MESNPINKNKKQLILMPGEMLRITADIPVLVTFSFECISTGDCDYTISYDKPLEPYGTESK